MSERIAVYPGSFDPVTFGHLDILDRAAAIFDRVVVGVLENPGKTPLFTAAERVELIRACLESRPRIDVTTFDGLTVDFAATTGAIAIVRGLRVISDFESEFQMALMNRRLNPVGEHGLSDDLLLQRVHLVVADQGGVPPRRQRQRDGAAGERRGDARRFAEHRRARDSEHVSDSPEGIDPP